MKIMRNYYIAVAGYARTSIATLPVQHHQVTAADVILGKTARLIAANCLRRMPWCSSLHLNATLSAQTAYVDAGVSVIAILTNVYPKLSVAAWWSTVAYKTHAKSPYCEPVLLQSKWRTWYLHFSEELEVEVESVEKPEIYFSGKVYCREKSYMITAFFWRIRGSEGQMIVYVATKVRYELVRF